MKRMFALLAVFSLVSISCEVTTNDGTADQPGDTEIKNVSFTIDTTYMLSSPGMLVARGLATNNGPGTVSSPWWIECQFYTDSTMLVKLGGNADQISVPLSPEQSAYWMITLTSSNVDVRRFPDFKVGDFRATYKN